LHELEQQKPDVLHTLGPSAFRAARIAQLMSVSPFRRAFPQWVACGAAGCGIGVRWLVPVQPYLNAALAFSAGEAERYRTRLRVQQVHVLSPAVLPVPCTSPTPTGLPKRFILASGGFDYAANLKSAVWAFDVLKYAEPNLHLVLLGDGPERPQLERLAHSLGFDDRRVHFAGWQPNVNPYLAAATVAWVTHRWGGTKFTLEAMAAGKPVLALRTADTESVLEDRVTGLLIPFADPVWLAATTRELLADMMYAEQLGCAGQANRANYTTAALGVALASIYDTLTRKTTEMSGAHPHAA
jgi:glycosyltransferase involved in cell wall biosynthesis